jgi:imidazole glycerol-phosphate synthase subunit HisF
MLKKRIIPCLDIKNGRTVKGIQFENIIDAGDPVALAKKYAADGADELVFLDITATNENRKTLTDLVSKIAIEINIPFTVGGGINTVDDAAKVILAGADKVSTNSAAVKNPRLVNNIAKQFGSQAAVVAIDAKNIDGQWFVHTNGGKVPTKLTAVEWAKQVVDLGAGEILLTSMNNDGAKTGFALDITAAIADAVNVPVIASGGAGTQEHFTEVFMQTKASAALAASIFHFNEIPISVLKKYLKQQNIPIR